MDLGRSLGVEVAIVVLGSVTNKSANKLYSINLTVNKGVSLWISTWAVHIGILRRGQGTSCRPAGSEVLRLTTTLPPFKAAQNAIIVNTRSSIAPCAA